MPLFTIKACCMRPIAVTTKAPINTSLKRSILGALCASALAFAAPNATAGPKQPIAGLKDTAWVDHKDTKTLKLLTQNDHDLFFLWGYFHAADRFFQMDVSRRQIQGELAALVGESALPEDFRNRMLGVRLASERTWQALDDSAKQALTAYTAGVNAYLDTGELPKEYGTLNVSQAKPWSPTDSIAIMKGVVIHLSLRLDTNRSETLQQYISTGQAEGFDGKALFFQDTHPIRPITSNTTYATAGRQAPYGRLFEGKLKDKPAQSSRLSSPQSSGDLQTALTQLNASLRQSTLWQDLFLADTQAEIGSNWWAVSAEFSSTGYPIVAGDPHLKTTWPGIFHAVNLRVSNDPKNGHLHAAGASIPGVPAIAHGQNEKLLWVSTNNGLDTSDVFLDTLITPQHSVKKDADARCQAASSLCILSEGRAHAVVKIPQTYHVNTSNPNNRDRIIPVDPPAEFAQIAQVPFRTYGPILNVVKPPSPEQAGQALVLQYTALAATQEIMSFLHWLRADTIAEFREGLDHFEVGSQNWLVTDAAGDLAYFSSGKVPLRGDLEAGAPIGYGPAFVRDGSGDANWLKPANTDPSAPDYMALPASEMPHIINPPSGMLINANNDPTGQTIDGNLMNQTRYNHTTAIYYLNHDYADGLRAQHITDRLTALTGGNQEKRQNSQQTSTRGQHRVTPQDLRALQSEAFQQDAIYLYPRLKAAAERYCTELPTAFTSSESGNAGSQMNTMVNLFIELCQNPFVKKALDTLSTWDYSTPTGIDWETATLVADPQQLAHSQATLYYHLWRAHLLQNLIYEPLYDHALPQPPARLALRALIHRLNQQAFTCQGASGLDFCGHSPEALPAAQRRDFALLDALVDVSETLQSDEFQSHLKQIQLEDWAWGAVHRQKFGHILAEHTATPFGIPASKILSRYNAWGGFPRAGGYEVVNAAPVPADATSLDALITEKGAARRAVGGMKKGFFKDKMRSTAVLQTGRRAKTSPEKMIYDWINNKHSDAFESETFMRLRWEKLVPKSQ